MHPLQDNKCFPSSFVHGSCTFNNARPNVHALQGGQMFLIAKTPTTHVFPNHLNAALKQKLAK
jgi:hypothetical protein